MTQLHRTPVWLEQAQLDGLRELAESAGLSVSDVVREALSLYLAKHNREIQKQHTPTTLAEPDESREGVRHAK